MTQIEKKSMVGEIFDTVFKAAVIVGIIGFLTRIINFDKIKEVIYSRRK